jgi:hypothetical protein
MLLIEVPRLSVSSRLPGYRASRPPLGTTENPAAWSRCRGEDSSGSSIAPHLNISAMMHDLRVSGHEGNADGCKPGKRGRIIPFNSGAYLRAINQPTTTPTAIPITSDPTRVSTGWRCRRLVKQFLGSIARLLGYPFGCSDTVFHGFRHGRRKARCRLRCVREMFPRPADYCIRHSFAPLPLDVD